MKGLAICLVVTGILAACASSRGPGEDVARTEIALAEEGPLADLDTGPSGDASVSPPNIEAMTRAFRLYYKERVERAILAFQRFQCFGDATFCVTVGRAAVSKTGAEWEVVPGPNDNNAIGFSTWVLGHAYRIFGTRMVALALMRALRGLAFQEAVSGHPGLTARHAYPGWTVRMDGPSGMQARYRGGEVVASPYPLDPALESEMVHAFFGDGVFTYREDPSEFYFSYMPAAELESYSITYSFSGLPGFLRVSDCCASLMRTPEPYLWAHAFWSNHNSRDNMPDLSLGYLAASWFLADPFLGEAAQDAFEAGRRVGDMVQEHGNRLMTVDEHHPYDVLVVAGERRPDGEVEVEDLGSMSDCAMAYVIRSLSSEGLGFPLPHLPLPGAIDYLIPDGLFDECTRPTEDPVCQSLDQAFCGKTWGTLGELHFLGQPWLEVAMQMDKESPGTGEVLLGSFQDDFEEMTLAMVGVVFYARLRGDEVLQSAAQDALRQMTELMRVFADIAYERTKPQRWREQRYLASLMEAYAGLEPDLDDLGEFERSEAHTSALEQWLHMEDTGPAPLMTDEEIRSRVEARRPTKSKSVQERYRAAYGDVPPVRRTEDGYEARHVDPAQGVTQWRKVERPHHRQVGGVRLLEALPLCIWRPDILDCTWAKMGCARADLDRNGTVDEGDREAFQVLKARFEGATCKEEDSHCEGADLDRDGKVADLDSAFMEAAMGCWVRLIQD